MPDLEKIESIKQCLSASCRGFRTCPYSDTEWDAIKTVLELLAEQEPVKPKKWIPKNTVMTRVRGYYCPICNTSLSFGDKYCHECGRRINWDE